MKIKIELKVEKRRKVKAKLISRRIFIEMVKGGGIEKCLWFYALHGVPSFETMQTRLLLR